MISILVVEDDEALGIGIDHALRKEEFNVDLKKTITDGEKAFTSKHYDLVLLDVMLPDGSGYDLCKKIRNSSKVPVIFLTACDEEVNIVLGLDIGGDDYITKPFKVKELISRIKAVLRRYSNNKNDKKVLSGDICIDLSETKVLKNNSEISLTHLEYKLLSVFIMNAMQTLSRSQILSQLWDMGGEFVDDNTLSVNIRRLREKIEDDPSDPEYIITVRGIGYKWSKPEI